MMKVKRNILLNPGPATTTDSVKMAMIVPDICPREKEFGDLTESVRTDLLKIVNAEVTHTAILLTSSGTGAVEATLTSTIEEGKKVLIINNGSYGKRMQEICEAYRIQHIDYDLIPGTPISLDELEDLIAKNLGVLSHVAFIHHETTVGMLNPLKEICHLSKKYNLDTIVDAMSSFAGIDIDVKRDKIDYLISSSNKCIQAMAGISFVIANKESLLKTTTIKRNFYFNLLENYNYLEKNKQFLFTPPVQTLYALRQAINEFFSEGAENRFKRYESMYEVMKFNIRELGLKFLVNEEHHAKLLTAILDPIHPNYSFEHMHDHLYNKGFTIYPGKVGNVGSFRLSNIGQIYPSDIENFFAELKLYFKEREII